MFCPNCGKELPENAKFCGGCGAAQPESPKKRKSKKGLVIALSVVLALLIAGAVFLLIPKTETVYMLTSYTTMTPNGQQEYRFLYDENGNPTRLFNMRGYQQAEASYDEYGNLTEITWYSMSDADRKYGTSSEYQYSYDDNGLIRSCKEYYMDTHIATWDFSWDRQRNLTQVILAEKTASTFIHNIVRQDWEYDKRNRLVAEYVWVPVWRSNELLGYFVYRCEYRYSDDSTLESYEYARSAEYVDDFQTADYADLDFEDRIYYRFTYTKNGNIRTCETNYGGEESKNTFDYDRDGNPVWWDSYEYDNHGNLLRASNHELEYEAVKLSPEAARRYYRWESLYAMDIPSAYSHPLISFAGQSEMFYYYLIPNPVW